MTMWQLPIPIKSGLKGRFEICDVADSVKSTSYWLSNGEIRGEEFMVGGTQDQMTEGRTSNDNPSHPHRDIYAMPFNPSIEYGISFTPVSFAISVVKDSIWTMSSSNLSIFEQPEKIRVFNDFN